MERGRAFRRAQVEKRKRPLLRIIERKLREDANQAKLRNWQNDPWFSRYRWSLKRLQVVTFRNKLRGGIRGWDADNHCYECQPSGLCEWCLEGRYRPIYEELRAMDRELLDFAEESDYRWSRLNAKPPVKKWNCPSLY